MTTATQQLPSDPARRLADKILARTNNGQDLIVLLHDISKGGYDASKNDRITAANFLTDRGYGKCPKQAPASGDGSHTSDPNPAPETDNNDVGAIRESPSAVPHKEPESPRLVTQVGEALHESLGPAPSACPEPSRRAHTPDTHTTDSQSPESGGISHATEHDNPDTSAPFDPTSIQDFIIEITNDGETLVDTLMEIADADPDDLTVTSRQRSRAIRILVDRFMGTNPTALKNGVCPDCRRKWTTHPGSPDHPEQSSVVAQVEEEPIDKEAWDRVIVELKEMEKRYNLDPNRSIPRNDYSHYLPPDDFDLTPYLHEADAFRAKIALQAERRKNWPEIEERRRKKLAQIYPSHSEGDDGSPDT